MDFLIVIFHLYLFIKHIVLHCIKVAQNIRENFSCQTDRDAELNVCYNESASHCNVKKQNL